MRPLVFKTLPTLPSWQVREVERLRSQMTDPAFVYEVDGILHWKSNGAIVPRFVYKDAFVVCPPDHEAAYEAETSQVLAEYRKAQVTEPSAEQRFEMLAAFGPGTEVVDVISGRRHRT